MSKKLFIFVFSLLCCCAVNAQEKNEFQKQAEAVDASQNIAKARSLYIRAFDDYAAKGQTKQGVECGVKAAALYYKESLYKESFELLRRIDQAINADRNAANSQKAGMHYWVT